MRIFMGRLITTGELANTLTNYDSIDGGAGVDTFNIYSDNQGYNNLMPSTVTVKNVETINVYNESEMGYFRTDGSYSTPVFDNNRASRIDASRFQGATSINQYTFATDIINLGANTTAGFYNQTYLDNIIIITAATDVSSVHIDVGNIAGRYDYTGLVPGFENQTLAASIGILGDSLNTVNITGSLGLSGAVTFPVNTRSSGLEQFLLVGVATDLNASTLTFTTSVNALVGILPINVGVGGLTIFNASASTGAISFSSFFNNLPLQTIATLLTGSGNDAVELNTLTSAAVNALVQTNDGNDTILINTGGEGKTTVAAGTGNDAVNIEALSSGLLAVDLGAGNDTFGAITILGEKHSTGGDLIIASDVIDGGTGTDTMSLIGIGSANASSFINFEVADVAGLANGSTIDLSLGVCRTFHF